MRAYVGTHVRCPVCGRPHHGLTLRDGDAWVTCWHRACSAVAWAVRVPAASPTAADLAAVVGERLAASLLATFAPAPVVVLEVPAAVLATIRQASRLVIVARLTQVLVGDKPVGAAVAPPLDAREAA